MIRLVLDQDLNAWLKLAEQVEPLFGKMVENEDFKKGMKDCVSNSSAFCVEDTNNSIEGIIAINKALNEVSWLAVSENSRGNGYGCQLLEVALESLDKGKPIYVQTFSPNVEAGEVARKIYMQFGFQDYKDGGKNPAGINTTIMRLIGGVNVIREMDINDYSNVMSLWGRTEGIGLSEADERKNISAFLSRNKGLSYVFIQDSMIIGAVLCGHDGRRGYIYHLAVESEYRGNKIGSKLITTCLDGLKAIGIMKCHLFVFNENELGKNFWSGNGWILREDILVFSKSIE